MIVVAKLKCRGCGESGSAQWKAYRPKLARELQAVRGRFIATGSPRSSRGAFLCEGCSCVAEATDEMLFREPKVPSGAMQGAQPAYSLSV